MNDWKFYAKSLWAFLAVPLLATGTFLSVSQSAWAADEEKAAVARCQVVPQAGHRVSLQVDGVEKAVWNFSDDYPRPFFFPLNGPSGTSLTRIGHPGAPNHDHHLSVWFAHHDVDGISFWANSSKATVVQKEWLTYQDGDGAATMAVKNEWRDAEGTPRLDQQVVASLIALPEGESMLEIQTTLAAPEGVESVVLGKTNFGLLAVRVAKGLSAHFGDGQLTSSEGRQGEKENFEKSARWMDYSGSVGAGSGAARKTVREGITYHDHPSNPGYPSGWHVRNDGWMGSSLTMREPIEIKQGEPLTVRYLLHTHRGDMDASQAKEIHSAFSNRPGWELKKAPRPHVAWEVVRKES